MGAEETTSSSPPSPSLLSPVGDSGGYDYSVAIDDDELDLSPVPHVREHSHRENDDSEWRYFDDEEDDPPRYRLDSDMRTPLIQNRESAKLNGLNYLNALTYLLNVFVSYGIGVLGLGGILPTRWEISKEFETLVTPAEWAYFLWAPILLFEAIFAVAQLFPHYRARRK